MTAGTKPLNVLMLLNRIPYPLNDGGAIGAYNFIKGYAGAGCNLTILAMNTAKHQVAKADIGREFNGYGKITTVFVDNRIKPIDALANLFSVKSYIIQRFISSAYADTLISVLKNNSFDVVHIDGLPPAAYIEIVRKHSNAKISMRAHNVEHVIWERIAGKEQNPLKKWYVALQAKRLKKFELEAIMKCDVVMAISKEDEDTIKEACPGAKTIVVPAGLDVVEKLVNENFNAADLFFIGSFDWMPNLQGVEWFATNVWPALNTRWPAVKITVAGKKMPEAISKYKSNSFIAVGEVPNARAFMLQHGIMVVPVISGSGIRIKILEGMALGKTIIATTIAAEGLGLKNGENILIADTAEEFAAQLQKCFDSQAFCHSIGENAHKFVRDNYTNSTIFEKLKLYYNNLI